MTIADAAATFASAGYAVFPRVLTDHLPMLREACADFIAREDARMDAAGVDAIGISLRGKRYFANECQREQPKLRAMLFSPAQYTPEPLVDHTTGHLRRNAIRLLQGGRQATFG